MGDAAGEMDGVGGSGETPYSRPSVLQYTFSWSMPSHRERRSEDLCFGSV